MDSNEEWTMEFLCTVGSTIAHCVLRVAFVPFHPVSPQGESPFNITVKATLTPNPSHECSRRLYQNSWRRACLTLLPYIACLRSPESTDSMMLEKSFCWALTTDGTELLATAKGHRSFHTNSDDRTESLRPASGSLSAS